METWWEAPMEGSIKFPQSRMKGERHRLSAAMFANESGQNEQSL
jgi:hypothetical protein